MVFRETMKNPSRWIRTGLVFLVLASLWRWFAHPTGPLTADAIDGIAGLLYGVSIGSMLYGLWRRRRGSAPRP